MATPWNMTPEEMAILGMNPAGMATSQIMGNKTFRSDMRRPPMPLGIPAPGINPSLSVRPPAQKPTRQVAPDVNLQPVPDTTAGLAQNLGPEAKQMVTNSLAGFEPESKGQASKGTMGLQPQQRAMLLRMAGALSKDPGIRSALDAQAGDIMDVAESKRTREAQLQAQQKAQQFQRDRWQAQDSQASATALAEQVDKMKGHAEILAYQNAKTPEEKAEIATGFASDTALEWYYKNAGGPRAVMNITVGGEVEWPEHLTPVNPDDLTKGFIDKNDPLGSPVQFIPGTNTSNKGDAGQLAMLDSSMSALELAKPILFNEQGDISRQVLIEAAGNVPFTDGRTFKAYYDQGIQAITRIETGAAMPQEELDNTRDRFLPQVRDTDELVRAKVRLFEDFLKNAKDYMILGPANEAGERKFIDINEQVYNQRLKQAEEGTLGTENVENW